MKKIRTTKRDTKLSFWVAITTWLKYINRYHLSQILLVDIEIIYDSKVSIKLKEKLNFIDTSLITFYGIEC